MILARFDGVAVNDWFNGVVEEKDGHHELNDLSTWNHDQRNSTGHTMEA